MMEKLSIGTYSFGMDSGMELRAKLLSAGEMGYTGVEFLENDLKGHSVEQIKAWLDEAGLEAVSVHCGVDAMSGLMPVMQALGGKMIITPMMGYSDRAEAVAFAKRLEEKGREAEKYGLKIGYHNHTGEFYEDEGKPLEEYVIEGSDPRYVHFQLDCGWAAAAGVDCAAFIDKYLGRFCSVHVKENNRMIGAEKPRKLSGQPGGPPPMELDADGRPVMSEEMKKMMAEMKERESIQCPMGDPGSRIDWKAIKAMTDKQANDCQWIVEREYDYCGDKLKCLAEDASWLLKNL